MASPRILIFKLGLLGDVLMTTPFVRGLRKNFPEAEIQYWVGASYCSALKGNPHLSSLVSFDERMFYRHNLLGVYRLWRQLRGQRFDIAFFLGKHWSFNALAASLGIPRRVGFAREAISRLFLTDAVDFHALRHEVHYYLDLLEHVGTPDYSDVKLEVDIPAEDQARIDTLLGSLGLNTFVVTINSGGNNAGEKRFVRRLPFEFFRKLVVTLSQKQPVVLLGNAIDREHYTSYNFPQNVINLSGQLSFQESLAVMKRAARVFSTDCGGMHMAATVNEHMTAFFGPAHPSRKAPFLSDIDIVWPDSKEYDPQYDLYNTGVTGTPFCGLSYTLDGVTINNSTLAART